jgi:DNA-binding beta-propeller fold protein YncE
VTTTAAVSAGPIQYIKTVGVTTNQSGRGFINPYDCAFAADGRILVLNHCDSARSALIRIEMLSWDEEYLGEFSPGYGRGQGQWMLPVCIALDSSQNVYVTDDHLHRITVSDLESNFIRQWGEKGNEPGQLNGPSGIAICGEDTVYVVEQGNNRVQRFTAEGKSLGMWGEAGER